MIDKPAPHTVQTPDWTNPLHGFFAKCWKKEMKPAQLTTAASCKVVSKVVELDPPDFFRPRVQIHYLAGACVEFARSPCVCGTSF